MTVDTQLKAIRTAMMQVQTGKISRRQFASRLGALGLAAAALPLFSKKSLAANSAEGGHESHGVAAQEGDGTPPAPATPVLGANADGTRTWKVAAGSFAPVATGLAEISAFLPGTITINAGDSIYFEVMGFHNVVFGAEGEIPPFVPAEGIEPVATPPAAGAGQPQLMFNPQIVFPAGGPTYDGTGFVNSGLPLDPTAPPFTLTFTTPGEYEYVCLIHPAHMRGKVVVQEAGATLPMEQDGVDAAAAEELAALVETANALATSTPSAANEVLIGPGEHMVELMSFLPNEVTIKAGESVRWTWSGSMSPHTVTFLGGAEPLADIIPVGGEAGPPVIAINPNTLYLSDSASQPYSGEGVVNSGYLGPFLPGGPETFELTFAAPGEYKYYCVLHAGGPDDSPAESMVGKVIVTE